MKIKSIMLKSGFQLGISEEAKSEIIIREVSGVESKGFKASNGEEDSWRWEDYPTKKLVNYLRIVTGDNIWEIKEDEIAAINYRKEEEDDGSLGNKGGMIL